MRFHMASQGFHGDGTANPPTLYQCLADVSGRISRCLISHLQRYPFIHPNNTLFQYCTRTSGNGPKLR